MHKKPLVAVLIFGLLLLVHSVGMAKEAPYNLPDDAQLLPSIARAIDKEAPASPTALSGPTTNIQAGVSRTGATFCDGEWQGGGAYYYGGWLYGDEYYAAYQDPENLGTCIGHPSVYTFDVTAINWFCFLEVAGPVDYDLQPLTYANGGDALCPVPGAVSCSGPLYTVTFPGGGAYILSLPFVDQCCEYADYFAGVYVATYTGPGVLTVIIDDGVTVPPATCMTYNDWGGGWYDFGLNQGYNLELWSEGMTWDQNTCPGIPGVCDWVAWYGDITYYTANPGGNDYQERFTRYNPDVECTLMTSAIMVYAGASVGSPTTWVSVYGDNGPIYGGRMYPGSDAYGPQDPANLIYSVEIPWGSLTTYPGWHIIDWSVEDPSWPNGYVYGTGQNCFVAYGISPNTPDPVNDLLATMLDGVTGSGHSGGYFGVATMYLYYDEAFGYDYGNITQSYFCCEVVELVEVPCSNPGPDDWPTWGHDYNRTCATSINVGDPCQVSAAWIQPMTGALNSFNEPTIADGLVYSSTDDKLWSFDLLTGTPGNTVSGLPYIFANNRGNMTTSNGKTFVTGGNGQSIGRWSADLSVNDWTNGLPAVGNGPLGGSCRFGVTAVYEAEPGVEVVVVGTESGQLWCFETATGDAYGGWAPNPVILPAGIWHSPAYDGDALYVGTANASAVEGNVYKIDAATGAIVWTFTPANPLEGFPGGVSLDGGYVYATSGDASLAGSRSRIDKGTGVADWEYGQSRSLYGCPAIGRNFVYMNQDVGGAGVLVVDKGTGAALYNFAANGVGPVTQHATITCDNYVFCGDRDGMWYLLDVNGQSVVWTYQFNGIVSGTAIASGSDMAVVSIRSGNSIDGGGYIVGFEFNGGLRPRAQLNSLALEIPVPFGTGMVYDVTETDLLSNIGCADLTVATQVNDPLPDVDFASIRLINEQSRYAAATANAIVGADYTAYFDNSSKSARIANRPLELVTDELTRGDVAIENARKAIIDSKRSSSRMAADASVPDRTQNVRVATPLAAGSSADVLWDYDGTNLKRGVDVEEIEFLTNDPDAAFFGVNPVFTITYIGGCLDDEIELVWNTDGNANSEVVYNYGRTGDDSSDDDFHWGDDPEDGATFYEGSFFLAGSEARTPGDPDTSQFFIANMYDLWDYSGFAGNPKPGTDECGFDEDHDIHMGYKRTGGCPGTAEEILGSWVRAYYVDTLAAWGGTVYEAIGLEITMTEVGANDPVYGDFALMKWDLTERYGEAEGPVYGGTWTDWDVAPGGNSNHGIVSDNFNGYALWDWVTPTYAFGFFDPRMTTDYCDLETSAYSPHRIQTMGQRCDDGSDGCGGYGLWQGDATGTFEAQGLLWDDVVNGAPRLVGPHENYPAQWEEDHFGLLVNAGLDFAGSDTKSIVQAKFGIDMSDVGAEGATDVGAADAKITALAKRAAIWGGWARGDVNRDDCINLLDVCWLGSGNQIYPDTYNGDVNLSGAVDAADANYLLQYVTGLGPAPEGEWRFTF